MEHITCIIIEDEKPAARLLKKWVENEGLEVVCLLHSVQEAVQYFMENDAPDLLFLDIQLGDGISFEIFEQVMVKSAIIFTTAYDDYAIKAFKLNSIDYLLKPINPKELSQAIDKFKQKNQAQLHNTIDLQQIQKLLNTNFEKKYKERFLIKIGTTLRTISTQEISCFYSESKSTNVCVDSREYPIDSSITELANELNPNDFFQISRSAIVHFPFVQDIVAYSGNRLIVKIPSVRTELIVSRERVHEFKLWLQQ